MDRMPDAVAAPLAEPAHRRMCTDCGISRSSDPHRCGRACQFIEPDYAGLERRVHGRARDPARTDETHFGPLRRMLQASLRRPLDGAQWSGITTRIAERLLETGAVDAVLTMGSDPADRWRPVPVLVTRPEDMAACRGMRMGYAPLLSLLEPARAAGHKRPGGDRHPLPGLRTACARGRARLREAVRDRNALFGQHHHRTLPRVPCAADRPARDHHLPGVPRGLPRRAPLRPTARSAACPSCSCPCRNCRRTSSR